MGERRAAKLAQWLSRAMKFLVYAIFGLTAPRSPISSCLLAPVGASLNTIHTMRRTYSVLVSFLLFAFSAFGAPSPTSPTPVKPGTDLPVVYDSSGRGELTLKFYVAESDASKIVLPFIGIQRGGGPAGFPKWDDRSAAPAFGGISTIVVRVRSNGTPNTTENVRLHLTSAGLPRTKVYAVERLLN